MTISVTMTTSISRRSLDAFFSESVLTHPDRPALAICDRSWSYKELDTECIFIEQALRSAALAGKGHTVGLIYARAMFSYAAVIAIMRSNCVYVPLNPKAPAERLLKIIEDAGLECVVIDTSDALSEEIIDAMRRSRRLQIICNDGRFSSLLEPIVGCAIHHKFLRVSQAIASSAPDCQTSDNIQVSPTELAYIIYTSGTTGEPKGVAISQESACRCIEKLHRLFETNKDDRFTQFSALSFDYSLVELFLCWKSGGALCVPAASEALVPFHFAIDHWITVWFSVPSLANFLLKLGLLKSNALPNVRISLLGGEALPFELAAAWAAATPQSRVFNLHGPTEVTIVSTYYEYERQSDSRLGMVPIGAPLPGLSGLVVEDGCAVEVDDVPGELWLAGDQLAIGYWKNAAATQAAFVRRKFADMLPSVWYRTGDLVSHRSGVGLSFRGRVDRQVKMRGFRIELQEIESVLRGVTGCALVAVVPIHNSEGICERIVAYCDSLSADESTIKARCLAKIPSYMVPERILVLDMIPINNHGKVDYLTLAARAASLST